MPRLGPRTAKQRAHIRELAKQKFRASQKPIVQPPTGSWWLGLDRSAFVAEIAKRERQAS